jgi:hypothetical protein
MFSPAAFCNQRYFVQLFLMEMLREHAMSVYPTDRRLFRQRRAAFRQNLQLTAIIKML